MDAIEFHGWRIEYDRPATVAVYNRIPIGGPDTCGCAACRNWAATRRDVLPNNFQSLLDQLGIPLDCEIEVYHNCRLKSGLHSYGAWYHFVGHVLVGERESAPDIRLDGFACFFHSQPALLSDEFVDLPVVQLEVQAEIPWLSDVPESN